MLNPISYVYHTWKSNCRRRGKPNLVTLEEFKEYNGLTNYVEERGRGANDQSIDRTDNEAGYVMGNMQPLTVSENSQKGYCPF